MNMLAFAIIGHLVGDYILQNDSCAYNKNWTHSRLSIAGIDPVEWSRIMWHSTAVCALHCLLWTASVCLFTGWWSVWWVPVVLFFTHFAQDRTTFVRWWMGKVGLEGFAKNLGPWSVILVDNTMHLMVIAAVARIIG